MIASACSCTDLLADLAHAVDHAGRAQCSAVRLPIGVALFAGALAGGRLPDSLSGEILDSKCWFGAMQPSDSKMQKARASLCVRGDVPPAFFARGPAGHGGS